MAIYGRKARGDLISIAVSVSPLLRAGFGKVFTQRTQRKREFVLSSVRSDPFVAMGWKSFRSSVGAVRWFGRCGNGSLLRS